MTVVEPIDMKALVVGLRSALGYGARAWQLAEYTPELVELLCPQARYPGEGVHARAIRAETLIRWAVDNVEGTPRQALHMLLCLASSQVVRPLDARRRDAARLFERTPRTFTRGRWEKDLFHALAVEVLRLLVADANPGTT